MIQKKNSKNFKLTWLGVAGFILKHKKSIIAHDPNLNHQHKKELFDKTNFWDLPFINAILISHGHPDHFIDLPDILKKFDTTIYLNKKLISKKLVQNYKKSKFKPLTKKREIHRLTKDISIEALRNTHIHFDLRLILETLTRTIKSKTFKKYSKMLLKLPSRKPYIYILTLSNKFNILTMGSAALTKRNKKILKKKRIDLFCIPIQGKSDILKTSFRLIQQIKPKTVLLYHWDDFYPHLSKEIDVTPLIKKLNNCDFLKNIYLPDIGETIKINYF